MYFVKDSKPNLQTEDSAKKDTYHGNCSNGNGAATATTAAANNTDNNNDDKEMLSECSHHTGD